MHRRIYQAIRARNAETRARQAMHAHLLQASAYQSQEPTDGAAASRPLVAGSQSHAGRAHVADRRPLMSCSICRGRTAVVVGGTSGIGRVMALGLADAGADVVVTGRRADRVEAVAQEIEARGRRTLAMAADAGDEASLERLRDACLQRARRHPHHGLRAPA